MPDYTISCVIPTYNRAHLVCDAIDSALAQTYPCHEIIVVDDGSTDNTEEVLRDRYGDKIIYLKQENAGPAAARNRGIESATGEWIAFLDSDDLWLAEKSERQVEALCANNVYFCCCRAKIKKTSGEICDGPYRSSNSSVEFYGSLIQGDWPATDSIIVKKSVFEKAGLFDEDLWHGEVWLMWARIANYCDTISIDKPLCCVRYHGANITDDDLAAITGQYEAFKRIIILQMSYYYKNEIRIKHSNILLDFGYSNIKRRNYLVAFKYGVRAIITFPYYLRPYFFLLGCIRKRIGLKSV